MRYRFPGLFRGAWLAVVFCAVSLLAAFAASFDRAPAEANLAGVDLVQALPLPGIEPDPEPTEAVAADEASGAPGPVDPRRPEAAGPCGARFCPWRAADALARAGFPSTFPTAPPSYLV